ncbi:MAG: FeoB-associated Cys-rich membrane protein [Clostridia bacterium]|nr:FeoB-associated Cys-rich membrane protein [Clostridia bacterium]
MDLPSIIVLAVIVVIVVAVVAKLISDRKKGKTSCSCGCSSCPSKDGCRK